MIGTHHDHDRCRVRLFDLAQEFDSVDAGEDNVQQNEVRLLVVKKF